jgi:hypothetical protein
MPSNSRRIPGLLLRGAVAVVIRILNLASRLRRDETDRPWLPIAPLIPMQHNPHRRAPYPLSVAEQRLLFSELATHLASMALFKVNTGLREQKVLNLRWQWEIQIPELGIDIGSDRHIEDNHTLPEKGISQMSVELQTPLPDIVYATGEEPTFKPGDGETHRVHA